MILTFQNHDILALLIGTVVDSSRQDEDKFCLNYQQSECIAKRGYVFSLSHVVSVKPYNQSMRLLHARTDSEICV